MTVRWAAFPRRHGDTVSDNLKPEYTKPPAISISVLTLLNNRPARSPRRSRPDPFVADTALHLGDAPHPGSALGTLKKPGMGRVAPASGGAPTSLRQPAADDRDVWMPS